MFKVKSETWPPVGHHFLIELSASTLIKLVLSSFYSKNITFRFLHPRSKIWDLSLCTLEGVSSSERMLCVCKCWRILLSKWGQYMKQIPWHTRLGRNTPPLRKWGPRTSKSTRLSLSLSQSWALSFWRLHACLSPVLISFINPQSPFLVAAR